MVLSQTNKLLIKRWGNKQPTQIFIGHLDFIDWIFMIIPFRHLLFSVTNCTMYWWKIFSMNWKRNKQAENVNSLWSHSLTPKPPRESRGGHGYETVYHSTYIMLPQEWTVLVVDTIPDVNSLIPLLYCHVIYYDKAVVSFAGSIIFVIVKIGGCGNQSNLEEQGDKYGKHNRKFWMLKDDSKLLRRLGFYCNLFTGFKTDYNTVCLYHFINNSFIIN